MCLCLTSYIISLIHLLILETIRIICVITHEVLFEMSYHLMEKLNIASMEENSLAKKLFH